MDIHRKALEWLDEGRSFAPGTVVYSQASTPKRPLPKPSSTIRATGPGPPPGTPRGGRLRPDEQGISDNIARLYEFRLDEAHSRDAGPICGGVTRLFANPRGRANAEHYREAIEAMERRERGRLVTALSRDTQSMGQAKWIAVENRAAKVLHGCREEDIERCLRAAIPLLLETEGGGQTLIEPLVPRPRLPIVGGGHVGQTVAPHIEPKPLSCK